MVLAANAAVIAVGVRWHESWADESQAWLIARDMSWWRMMSHGVRYEGAPGLWHTILWVLIKLHVGFAGMHWIAGAFALSGAFVLMRFSPFPRVLRWMLPFCFFLVYQDAVVARSYVVFALLAFSAAALLERESERIVLLAAVLGLLANLSVHGFIASIGFACILLLQVRKRGVPVGRWLPASLLLCALWIVAVATALPPKDIDSTSGMNVEQSLKKVEAVAVGRPAASGLPVAAAGELARVEMKPHHYTRRQSFLRKAVRVLSLITFPISSVRVLALLAFGLVTWHGMVTRRSSGVGRCGLLPYLLMLPVFTSLYIAPRHAGTLFTIFVVSAWLTWPRAEESRGWHRSLTAVLCLVCVHQILWTAEALRADIYGQYAPGPMTARLLADRPAGSRVAGFYYHSISPLPYFSRNIYENQGRHGYWFWSATERVNQNAPAELSRKPEYVVVSGWTWGDTGEITADWVPVREPDESADGRIVALGDNYEIVPYFEAHGYRETHRFCGRSWMRAGYSELLCDVVLQPGR